MKELKVTIRREGGEPLADALQQLHERLAELQGRVEALSQENGDLKSLLAGAGIASADDVSNLKRAQEALRESEERYRSLVENAQIAIFVNRNGRIDYANPAAVSLFGAQGSDGVVGRSPNDFVHPECHAAMSERIGILLDGGSVALSETRIVRGDGTERCVEVTAATFVDPQGPAIQVMMHDVTERKEAAEALFKSEEQFRTLADAIPQLCWMAHPDGRIFWFNRHCHAYTGCTTAQLEGWGWQSVTDPRALPEVLKRWRVSLATGEPFDMEFPLKDADGAYRPFLTRVLPLKDAAGRVLRWFGTNTDISALKQVESALRVSERRYATLFDNGTNGMAHCRVITDNKGRPVDYRILQINDAYERIIGIRKGDIEGRRVSEVFPEIGSYAFDYIGNYGRIALEGGELKFEEFFEATGQYLSIYAYSPLPGEFTAIFTDVTERKRAEEELRKLNDQLELRVRLRTENVLATLDNLSREIAERKQAEKQLQEALESARAANSIMTRSMRTIAHEFRTPLGLLTGSTDILDRYWDRMTPEMRLEQNGQIRNAAHQIGTLVNSVTSFQLCETEQGAHPPQLCNVAVLARAIGAEVEKVWGVGHRFVVRIADDCGTVLIDEILFRRMLQNLLSNAFRYTLSNGTVSLSVCRKQNMLLVDVTDTGIGIPEEDQALIFDAFYRSRNVEDRRGLGLGLSIVRDALVQVGGTINVTSTLGEGTAVAVKIPTL